MSTENPISQGPSRTYAQAVKDPSPPQTKRPPSFEDIMSIPCDDEWTDVSSVTSCAWPGSVKAESIASDEGHSPTKDEKRAVPEVVPETIEDTPWIDEDTDTRVPHALAGQIKHINRSRWKFTNIDTYKVNCCNLHSLSEAPPKPWRPFPGCRYKYWHRDHYRIETNVAIERRYVRGEMKEAKES